MAAAVLQTSLQKLLVQTFHRFNSRYRNQKIVSAISYQIFNQTLFIAAGYIAEVSGKHIMS